jgi:hypothetical protein
MGSSVVPRFAGAENSNRVENQVASGNCEPYHGPSSGWTYQKIVKIGGKNFEYGLYRRVSPNPEKNRSTKGALGKRQTVMKST